MQGRGVSGDLYVRKRAKQPPCVIYASEHAVSRAQTKQSGLVNPGHPWPMVFPAEQDVTGPCGCGLPAPPGRTDALLGQMDTQLVALLSPPPPA